MKVRNWRRTLLWAEYLFLFAGLIAIDYYIWISASAALSQAYENWSFSETLEGREPSIRLFFRTEIDSELGKHATSEAPAKVSEAPRPAEKPFPTATLEESALIGRIAIPRLGLNVVVREGVTEHTLRSAVGHIRSSALPGQPGNVALAAHRDTFFRPLRYIEKGNDIFVETRKGTYRYVVDSIQIVMPKDISVLEASSQPSLTLITCYPFYYVGSAPKRFIVRGRLVAGTPQTSSTSSTTAQQFAAN